MSAHPERVLVLVAPSRTLRLTVDHAVETALATGSAADPATVRFVYVYPAEAVDETGSLTAEAAEAAELLDRVSVWAEEDAGDDLDAIDIETGEIGQTEYLFSPSDIADSVRTLAREADFDRIVLDPEYDPGVGAPLLRPLEHEIEREEGLEVTVAPVVRPTRRPPLFRGTTPKRIGALFGVSFVFYQLLIAGFHLFDIVTGAITAVIVALTLSRISLTRGLDRRSPGRLLRLALYVPYLLWEIIKANVQVAAVILRPSMPIEPEMTRIEAAVWGSLPVTTLANSITLTPGTLSVRVRGRSIIVHTLIPAAKEGLFDGGLERGVRFVFYGRGASDIESPRERGATATYDADASVASSFPDPEDGGEEE